MRTVSFRSALSILLVSLLLAPLPALAALSSSDQARLDQFEQTVFGQQRPNLSDETRMRALETNIFGKPQSGSATTRLNSLSKMLAKVNPSLFWPPRAVQMDTSVAKNDRVAPAPAPRANKPAPAVSFDDDYDDPTPSAPAVASSEERAKSILRDALAKYSAGNVNEAERLFKQVLSIEPKNADANFNLGALAEQKGDLNQSLRYYKAALNSNPSDGEFRDAVAAVEQKMHQNQVAKAQQSQIAKKQELKKIADDAAAAYKAGKFDQAAAGLQRIVNQDPNDGNARFGLAQALRGKGDLHGAQNQLSAALSIDPNNQLYRSTMNDLQAQINKKRDIAQNRNYDSDHDGMRSFDDSGSMPPTARGIDDGSAPGQLTPFANDDMGGSPLYGRAYENSRGSGLGAGLGSALGFGGLAGGLAGGMRYNTGGSRIKRVVGSSLAGAALGAMAGAATRSGVKSGAMKGALYGGLMGLIGF